MSFISKLGGFWEELKKIHEDNSGGTSSIRVWTSIWLLLLMSNWTVACFRSGTMQDIPTGVVTLTLGLIAGKVVQRYGETAVSSPPSN